MRDTMPIMARYEAQVIELQAHFEQTIDVYICEGNSTDQTYTHLSQHSPIVTEVAKLDTGVRRYSHLEDPARWANLTMAWNCVLGMMNPFENSTHPPYDYAILLECELLWTPTTLLTCIANLEGKGYDVIAPGLFCDWDHNRFYDTNGFRTPSGEKWHNERPFYPGDEGRPSFIEVSSVGGMIVMRGELLSEIEWRDTCRLHYPPGTKVYADMSLRVWHP